MKSLVQPLFVPGKFPAGVKIELLGLTLPDKIPYEDWAEVLWTIARGRRACTWALGDAINEGENRFSEKFSQAVSETGYAESSLIRIAWVCGRVHRTLRREELSFEHHAAVAKVEAHTRIKELLQQAVDERLTASDLRRELKDKSVEQDEGEEIECPSCHFQFRWKAK